MTPLSRRLLLPALLLAAAAISSRAASVETAAPVSASVYPMPSPAFTHLLTPAALSGIHGLDPAKTQQLAPIAYELSHGLGLTPDAFAKMDDHDRASACQLAAEQARHDLTQKAYELVAKSKALVWGKEGYTKADLDALYPLAAQLREIDRHYGAFLGPDERDAVAAGAAQSAAAWRDARAAFVAQFGEATAKALRTGKESAAAQAAPSAAKAPKPLTPGTSARKIRERMQGTKSGWGESDFETLYTGYGFAFRDGAKHRMYFHPDFPQLHTTVSRQRSLPPGYAQDALKLISELETLSAPAGLPAVAAKADDDELPPPLTETRVAEKQPEPKAAPRRLPEVVASLDSPLAPEQAAPAAARAAEPRKAAKPATAAPKKSPFQDAVFTPVETAQEAPKAPWWRRLLGRSSE